MGPKGPTDGAEGCPLQKVEKARKVGYFSSLKYKVKIWKRKWLKINFAIKVFLIHPRNMILKEKCTLWIDIHIFQERYIITAKKN